MKSIIKLFIPAILLTIFTITSILAINNRPTEINILMPAPFADSTSILVNEFNKQYLGQIKLNVIRGPLETESVSDLAISSLLLDKGSFDVLLMDVTWLPKYAAAGWLKPLDYLITKEDLDSLAPGAEIGNTYNKKLYRWPLVADMGLLYWRKDLMTSPPKTPQELLKVSRELQKKGLVKYGYVWQGRQYEGLSCVFLEVLKGFGGEWISKNDEVGLNSPSSIKAASWLKELITSQASPLAVTNYSEPEALQAFESGDAAFMRNWPYAWSELQKKGSSVQGKVGVTTMVSEPGQENTATQGSWGFSILKHTDNPEAALKAINFLSSETSQKYLSLNNGYTPTRKSLFNDQELINNSPILPVLEDALNSAVPRPITPLYAQISDVLQRQLSSLLTDEVTAIEAMEYAQLNTEQILISTGKLQ